MRWRFYTVVDFATGARWSLARIKLPLNKLDRKRATAISDIGDRPRRDVSWLRREAHHARRGQRRAPWVANVIATSRNREQDNDAC